MALEFDSAADLNDWIRKNTKYENGKMILVGANEAIRQARRDGARIFNEMRREAKALGIPDGVIDTDLAAFTDEFCVTDDGEIRSLDKTHTVRTFLGKEQVDRPHWNGGTPTPPPTSPKPDVTKKTETVSSLAGIFESGESKPTATVPSGDIASLFES